jgi:hypothetical protein
VPCSASRVVPGAHRVVGPGTHRGSGPREVHTTGGWSRQRLLGHEGFGLGLIWVRSEVELVGGVRVVAGDGVGVRSVVGDDLLAGPARSESLRMGLASVADAIWEVIVEWRVRTRWLDSRLTCDGPRRRRVRVGVGSKLKVGVLVIERNFAEFSGEFTRDYLGKRHEPSARVGSHGEAAL